MSELPQTSPRGVLVTGGASGIGRAVARAHVALGDRVVVLDRDEPVDTESDGIVYLRGDVTSFADNVAAVDSVIDVAGHLDHFVGNAGVHDGGLDFRATTGEDLERILRGVLDVNVLGYVLGAKASAEALIASSGCMTFTLSDATFVVAGNGAGIAYSTSKHAGLGVVRHLASELAPHVRVNAVAPGGCITGLRAHGSASTLFDDAAGVESSIAQLNPLGVVSTPEELAGFYLFLASSQARGMTGEVLRPDGGLSVRTTPHHVNSSPSKERRTS